MEAEAAGSCLYDGSYHPGGLQVALLEEAPVDKRRMVRSSHHEHHIHLNKVGRNRCVRSYKERRFHNNHCVEVDEVHFADEQMAQQDSAKAAT